MSQKIDDVIQCVSRFQRDKLLYADIDVNVLSSAAALFLSIKSVALKCLAARGDT